MWNIIGINIQGYVISVEDLRRALKIKYIPSNTSPELNMSFGETLYWCAFAEVCCE